MDPLKTTRTPITKEDIAYYDTNGCLIVEDILSSEECDSILQIYESHADENFSAILNLDREGVSEIRNLMKLPKIVSTLDRLQRWEVDAVQSIILFKRAGSGYTTQAWNPHQDNSYPQAPYPGYITINIFLADADLENGCMYLYPGSHIEPLLPFVETKSYREAVGTNPGNTVEVPEGYDKVDLVIKKGAMLVLNGHLIHGSYPNNSNRSRPLCSISYVTKGVEFIPGKNAKRMRINVH